MGVPGVGLVKPTERSFQRSARTRVVLEQRNASFELIDVVLVQRGPTQALVERLATSKAARPVHGLVELLATDAVPGLRIDFVTTLGNREDPT